MRLWPVTSDSGAPARQSDALAPLLDARFLIALLVLIINDQFLKATFGNWVTGKLSDVTGLVVLPVLVGVGLHAAGGRHRTAPSGIAAVACVTVGVWFTAMKVVAPVARFTETLFEAISGRPSTIIIDPTDLVGLAGLVVAAMVMQRPRPLVTRRQVGCLSLVVAAFACTATSGPEYYSTDLGVDPETGAVIEKQNDPYLDETPEDQVTVPGHGQFNTEACVDQANGGGCFRIVGARVERQIPGGDWEPEWIAFDVPVVQVAAHGGWGPSIEASDIVTGPDGAVHVGFFDEFGPIVRSSTGEWSPAAYEFRPLGWLAAIYVGLIGAVLAMATRVRYAGGIAYTFALLAVLGFLISWSGGLLGFEMLGVFGVTVASVVVGLVALGMNWRRKGRLNLRRLAIASAGLALGLMLAFTWKYVLTAPSWLYIMALVAAVAGVTGAFFARHPPPPPPTGQMVR